MDNKSRLFGLDILRATAILIVIFTHSYYYLHLKPVNYLAKIVPDGVTLFFVLSGFLIGNIILKYVNDNSFPFKRLTNFWIRRWFRTLPAYFVVISLLFAFQFCMGEFKNGAEHLKYYFFIQSITDGEARLYGESWSLCVEEWFYLLVPFALFVSMGLKLFRKQQIFLFWIFLIIILVTLIRSYRVQFCENVADWDRFSRKALITRLDSIMYGLFGAYLSYYNHPIWKKKNTLFIIGILLLFINISHSFIFGYGFFTKYFSLTVQSLSTLLLLPKLRSMKAFPGRIPRIITFISMISYSMYLLNGTPFHEFVLRGLKAAGLPDDAFFWCDLIRFVAFVIWAFLGSWLLYKFVEVPMLKLRDYIYPEVKKQQPVSKTSEIPYIVSK